MFDDAKKHRKVRDHDHYTGKFETKKQRKRKVNVCRTPIALFEDIKNDLKEWSDTSGSDKNIVLPDEYAKLLEITKRLLVR